MRIVVLAALLAGAIGVFACGDYTSPSAEVGEDGGVPSETGDDAGTGKRAPSGCLLRSTGFKTGAKAESVARTDMPNAAPWTDVDQARALDGKYAQVTLADGQGSAVLRVSDFAFAIPAEAETWGLEVALTRQAPDGGLVDERIDVDIENQTTRRYKSAKDPWPKSAIGTHPYGQEIDTWGMDLEPADFNRSEFAALLTVKRLEGVTGPVTGIVDALRVAVHYCPEPAKQ